MLSHFDVVTNMRINDKCKSLNRKTKSYCLIKEKPNGFILFVLYNYLKKTV